MSHRLSHSLFIIVLGILMFSFLLLQAHSRLASAQTIPTRTPTPSGGGAGGATATSGSGGPGPNPTSPPTSTSQPPQATATNTPFPIPPTPEAGFLPTALPCASDPTLRSLASGVNVRSGPGLDYAVVGNLLLNEVRPIVGRAAQATWWQTVLADGTPGWISDSVVSVSGYIGDVPLVDAPPLDSGATVTPGTPWAPTPGPDCTPPPSATPTGSPTPSPTPQLTATEDLSQNADTEADGDAGEPEVVAAATVQPAATSEATATALATSGPTATISIPTAEPLPGEDGETTGNFPWIPVVGGLLILAAAGIFVFQRIRP